ncbi:hypothetical protein [Candidatus Electronema sp. PJ]|uniref:hypothetical protein n=1 Tax=Candidatus Electronema sp. PJ TaxID=3401572 RepID=UPI003AA844D9
MAAEEFGLAALLSCSATKECGRLKPPFLLGQTPFLPSKIPFQVGRTPLLPSQTPLQTSLKGIFFKSYVQNTATGETGLFSISIALLQPGTHFSS